MYIQSAAKQLWSKLVMILIASVLFIKTVSNVIGFRISTSNQFVKFLSITEYTKNLFRSIIMFVKEL